MDGGYLEREKVSKESIEQSKSPISIKNRKEN